MATNTRPGKRASESSITQRLLPLHAAGRACVLGQNDPSIGAGKYDGRAYITVNLSASTERNHARTGRPAGDCVSHRWIS
jgi:hypothetical protein